MRSGPAGAVRAAGAARAVRARRSAAGPVLLAVAAVALGLVLLRPVLLGPVTGDDVYYLFDSAAADRTVVDTLTALPEEWSTRVGTGRVNVLTVAERRTAGHLTVDAAVATGRPVHHVQALLKAGYLALGLLAVHALLRTLRWRRRDTGALVALDRRTLVAATVAGGLLVAVGAQPQLVGPHGWNGWLSYPVSTWTATLSVFGVVALALWLARLAADRGARAGVPAAAALAAVGVLTNYRYELTFAAVPLVLVALAVVPVTDRGDRHDGVRAKLALGAAYLAGFVPLLLVHRRLVAEACARGECYGGVRPDLGPQVVGTWWRNVLSTVPGTGGDDVRQLLRAEGVPVDGAWTPTAWSAVVALLVLAVLLLAWRVGGHAGARRGADSDTDAGGDADEREARGRACLAGAGLLLLGTLGTAAVMSLSADAQAGVTEVGLLYRHVVVGWTGLAFALVLAVLALGLLRPRAAWPSYAALALATAVLTAVALPADGRVMDANASRMQSTTRVFAEVVRGDTGPASDARRCRLLRRVDREMTEFHAWRVGTGSRRAFRHYWGEPFCTRR